MSDWPHGPVGIVGTGCIATAFAKQYALHGVPLVIGSRTAAKAAQLAEAVGGGAVATGSIAEVVARCETLWLPLPNASEPGGPDGVIHFLNEHKDALVGTGKRLLVSSNPYLSGNAPPAPFESQVEYHAAHLRSLGDTTCTFATGYKSIYYKSIAAGAKQPTEICGDGAAHHILTALTERIGWTAADYGDLSHAPKLEPRG